MLNPEEVILINSINNYRTQNSLVPLQVSITLTRAATFMSNDLATNNRFSHTDSLGRSPQVRVRAFGYPANTATGENIAVGSPSGQVTFQQWVDSPDPNAAGVPTFAHRANMLNPAWRALGVSRAFNANSTYQWYWVADFGTFIDATIPIPAPVSAAVPTVTLPTPQIQTANGQQVTITQPVVTATIAPNTVVQPTNNALLQAVTTPVVVVPIPPNPNPVVNNPNPGINLVPVPFVTGNSIITPTRKPGIFRL